MEKPGEEGALRSGFSQPGSESAVWPGGNRQINHLARGPSKCVLCAVHESPPICAVQRGKCLSRRPLSSAPPSPICNGEDAAFSPHLLQALPPRGLWPRVTAPGTISLGAGKALVVPLRRCSRVHFRMLQWPRCGQPGEVASSSPLALLHPDVPPGGRWEQQPLVSQSTRAENRAGE